MCDVSPVRNWLLAIIGAIAAAFAFTVVAAALQGSWWTAWGSPIFMGLAAGSAAAGAAACGGAISALNTYCACAGGRCAGACSTMRNTLTAAAVVLGVQAAACAAAAVVGGNATTIYVITAALIAELALMVAALVFLGALGACTSPPMPKPSSMGPVG